MPSPGTQGTTFTCGDLHLGGTLTWRLARDLAYKQRRVRVFPNLAGQDTFVVSKPKLELGKAGLKKIFLFYRL
jgi:hypothetical protein